MAHRVVIVGAGFAGLKAAQRLGNQREVTVTVIDRRNHHIFQPLLYQVATGGLSPGDIAAPIRGVLKRYKNVETVLGEVAGFDVGNKLVITQQGTIPYDSLIVATGSETSYFGNDAWQEHAPGLKTIEEATEIRSRVLYAFEQAELEPDADRRREWMTFVIVGAGPTGVELAGTLGEIARDTLKDDFRRIQPADARILLMDGNARVLMTFPESLSKFAEDSLIRLGVRFRNNVRVVDVCPDHVKLKTASGQIEDVRARTVLWAAGVKASPLGALLATSAGQETDRGRVKVDKHCNLPGHPDVYVLGDLASFPVESGHPLPGVAQVALQMGTYSGKRILKSLRGQDVSKPFSYWDKGNMATIGRGSAVADLGKIRFGGLIAWLMWIFVHIMYIVEYRSRVLVAIQWFYQYISFYRGPRLITGLRHMISPNLMPRE